MPQTYTPAEKKALTEHLLRIKAVLAGAEAENRGPNETEENEVNDLLGKVAGIKDASLKRAGLKDALSEFADLEDAEVSGGVIVPGQRGGKASKVQTIGGVVTESEQYKALMSRASGGQFAEKTPIGHMDAVPMPGLRAKTLVTSGGGFSYDTSGSANIFLNPDHLGLTQDATTYQRPLVVAALFSHGTTTTDTIDYVITDTVTNNAAPVAEATTDAAPSVPAGTDAGGGNLVYPAGAGLKPQSSVSFKREKTSVKTIAHGMAITKRALSDASQVMSFIDNFLQYGLAEEVENQLLSGDGTGENLLGIENVSGVLTQGHAAASTYATTDARRLVTMRKAKTKIRTTAHVNPTAYLVSPTDYESFEVAAMTTGQYLGGGPFGQQGVPTLWGLPLLQSEAVSDGAPWLAAWDRAIVFDRMETTVTMTDSHADFFMRNLVQILAELRLAFAVLNPKAFCKITLPTDNTTA